MSGSFLTRLMRIAVLRVNLMAGQEILRHAMMARGGSCDFS